MCDEFTVRDDAAYLARRGLTRRDFGKAGASAALLASLPVAAGAKEVVENEVSVPTPDGEADGYLVHPASDKHAAVIIWPDIMGIRTSFRAMGKRLAQSGYTVLVVNPYYRTARGNVIEDGEAFADPETRERLLPHARSLSPETCVTDGRALIRFLDQHASVDTSRPIGSSGYCMTGSYPFRLAADMPDRLGAGCSFHGGGLATDAPDSPHRLVAKMQAGFLVAIAENDDEKDPDDKVLLREAFDSAGLNAEIEVYKGAMHGWCPPDSRVYNEEQAERAWSRMLTLFERELA